MAAGLQIWNDSGVLIFDGTTSLVKILGTISIGSSYTGSAQSGSISIPQFAQYPNNKGFFARSDGGYTQGVDAVIWISGSSIYWQFPTADAGAYTSNGVTYYANRPDQTFMFGLL